jgi:ABC-2 type transport system permease protein
MNDRLRIWQRQAHGVLVVAEKNALLYYLKPPVLIFGVLFPIFFFLAFKMGRDIPTSRVVPGMIAMALWFTASAVGPLVTPWERRAKTYERLISSPLALRTIVVGDITSGFLFGFAFTFLPVGLGLLFTQAVVADWIMLTVGVFLGALTFSTLGVLLASPPATSPSHIMMLSNLVRLPLLFVSGVFVPIAEMPPWARWLAPISPLSYAGDLIRRGFGQPGYYPPSLDVLALIALVVAMFCGSWAFHRRWRSKGL